MYKKILNILLLGCFLLLFVQSAHAGFMDIVQDGYNLFLDNIATKITSAITSTNITNDVNILWAFFAVFLVIWTMFTYAFGKGTLLDLLTAAILIMITKILMGEFDVLTKVIWEAANGFASDIQVGLLGNGDLFFAPQYIADKFLTTVWNKAFPPASVGSVVSGTWGLVTNGIEVYMNWIVTILMAILAIILSILAYISVIWAYWGYAIAKLIGLLFIPFLMYERLAWLFDGWLRFFFGFVVYAIVVRINISLVMVALSSYTDIEVKGMTGGVALGSIPATIVEMTTLLVFTLTGIIAILSTGKFVGSLVGGSAASTGIGGIVLRGASMMAGKIV
jgi:hypothetical protein